MRFWFGVVMFLASFYLTVVLFAGSGRGDARSAAGAVMSASVSPEVEGQFMAVLRELCGEESALPVSYFLYDLSGDGVPELWVDSGTCEADRMLSVYRYTPKGARRVLHTASGHTSYYVGRNYVILRLAHMGDDVRTYYRWRKGKPAKYRTKRLTVGPEGDYVEPAEPCVEPNVFDSDDTALKPLRLMSADSDE